MSQYITNKVVHGKTLELEINAALGSGICIGVSTTPTQVFILLSRDLTSAEITNLETVIDAHNPDDETVAPGRVARRAILDRLAGLEGLDVRDLTANQHLLLLAAIYWRMGIIGADLKVCAPEGILPKDDT